MNILMRYLNMGCYFFYRKLLWIFSLVLFMGHCFALSLNSSYQISFNPPLAMQWQVVNTAQDDGGYMLDYMPNASANKVDQSISINFERNVQTSLSKSMQEIVNLTADEDCDQNTSQVLVQQQNYIIFTITLADCENNVSIQQIYKIFNMPDGQYSISYTADPDVISQQTINTMQTVIKNATLTPIQSQ